jgi:uncharacterized membrane protein YdjX (TVP38/TMEM64 family)
MNQPRRHPIREFFRKIGPAGPMALIVTAMPAVGTLALLTVVSRVSPWLRDQGWPGVVIFIAAFALLNGFALITTYANSLLGGWTFKFPIGFPVVMVSLIGAAMIGYSLAHRIVGHRVQDAIAEHPKWELVRRSLIGGSTLRSTVIVTLLRISPLLPFETTNALLSMCGVRFVPFIVGTTLGIIPRVAAVVWAGSQMHKLTLDHAPHPMMIAVGLAVTAASLIVVMLIARHGLKLACASGGGAEPTAPACEVSSSPSRQT